MSPSATHGRAWVSRAIIPPSRARAADAPVQVEHRAVVAQEEADWAYAGPAGRGARRRRCRRPSRASCESDSRRRRRSRASKWARSPARRMSRKRLAGASARPAGARPASPIATIASRSRAKAAPQLGEAEQVQARARGRSAATSSAALDRIWLESAGTPQVSSITPSQTIGLGALPRARRLSARALRSSATARGPGPRSQAVSAAAVSRRVRRRSSAARAAARS